MPSPPAVLPPGLFIRKNRSRPRARARLGTKTRPRAKARLGTVLAKFPIPVRFWNATESLEVIKFWGAVSLNAYSPSLLIPSSYPSNQQPLLKEVGMLQVEFKVPGTNGGSLRVFLGRHLPHRQERLFDFKSVALAEIDAKNSTYK